MLVGLCAAPGILGISGDWLVLVACVTGSCKEVVASRRIGWVAVWLSAAVNAKGR